MPDLAATPTVLILLSSLPQVCLLPPSADHLSRTLDHESKRLHLDIHKSHSFLFLFSSHQHFPIISSSQLRYSSRPTVSSSRHHTSTMDCLGLISALLIPATCLIPVSLMFPAIVTQFEGISFGKLLSLSKTPWPIHVFMAGMVGFALCMAKWARAGATTSRQTQHVRPFDPM
jgi:hypothetical protein